MKKKNRLLASVVLVASILVGGVAWGFLYSYGWFVGILAFVTAFLAVMAYDKFCPVSNAVYIFTAIAIVVVNVVASFLSIGVRAAIENEITLSHAFNLLFKNFNSIAKDFAIDMVLCVVMTCLGVYGFKRTYEQRRSNQIGKTTLDTGMVENETLRQNQLRELEEKVAEKENENDTDSADNTHADNQSSTDDNLDVK